MFAVVGSANSRATNKSQTLQRDLCITHLPVTGADVSLKETYAS